VLGTVREVKQMRMDTELSIADVVERFRTLSKYEDVVHVDEDEARTASQLLEDWQEVVDWALTKDARLDALKQRFATTTLKEAEEFSQESVGYLEQYQLSGPSSPDVSLDDGLQMLDKAKEALAVMQSRADELSDAQRLFGMDVTRYPELGFVKEDLGKVERLFQLYQDQKMFAETNSNMLWSALDTKALEEGSERLQSRARKQPAELKEMPLYAKVRAEIEGFGASLPLISKLKNEAMKERHWKKLMELTGVQFSMNPKTFTLQGIFEMNLSRFEDTIDDIVTEATNELKIERDIDAISRKWRSSQLQVGEYAKNGVFRAHLLLPADEIKVELEDHTLQLQTIQGSRFVTTFATLVKQWSDSLSIVGETLDVWYAVQDKWRYLEGIFIGNEDIKMQLPAEAKRFAGIDKQFKAIMQQVVKSPAILESAGTADRRDELIAMGEMLDACQKSLSEYLDSKRNAFPRFFFISDDELLAVLGSSDPRGI